MIPLISIPVIIHFLNKRNIKIIDFSTLYFLKKMEHESIRKLKILQILLLIIRTIMILLVILMMSRPVMQSFFSWVDEPESTFSAIVIDDTFSTGGMGELIDRKDVKENAFRNILKTIDETAIINISTTSGGIIYHGLKKDIPATGLAEMESYQTGQFDDVFGQILRSMEEEYINHEIFVISDGQISNFYKNEVGNSSLSDWNKYFIKLPQLNRNLSLTNVSVENEVVVTNLPITIRAVVSNTGSVKVENVLLQLFFDGISVGQQVVTLDVSESSTFEFQTAFHSTGLKQGIVELQTDDQIGDNSFYFQIDIPRKLNLLLASKTFGEMLFILNAMNSLNKDDELFSIKQITDQEFKYNMDLRDQDILILQGIDEFSTLSQNQIKDFLNRQGHLIIFPGRDNDKLPDLTWLDRIDRTSSRIDLGNESFQLMNFSNLESETFSNLFSGRKKRDVKLFSFIPLLAGENTRLMVGSEISIWNRLQSSDGIVDVFGVSMDLKWTNFPLMGDYIPFWHMLLYSTTDKINEEILTTGSPWDISNIPDITGKILSHISPDGRASLIQIQSDKDAVLNDVKIPGFHQIMESGSIINERAVNIPESEMISPFLSDDELSDRFSGNLFIIDDSKSLEDMVISARTGFELWKWFLILFSILLITEMIIANVYGSKKL